MKARCGRVAAYGLFLAATTSCSSIALAQSTPPTIDPPPVRSPVDQNGVNMATGGIQPSSTDLSIGVPGAGGLMHSRTWSGNDWRHGYFMTTVAYADGSVKVLIGGQIIGFTPNGSGVLLPDQGDGSTLTATTGYYTYRSADGTTITFDRSYNGISYYGLTSGVATSIVLPSGEKITLTYKKVTNPSLFWRLQS